MKKTTYLNVSDLAEYINLSRSTIYKMTSSRRIPFIKSGKMLIFNKDTIDEWLNEHAHQPIGEKANYFNNILKRNSNESI